MAWLTITRNPVAKLGDLKIYSWQSALEVQSAQQRLAALQEEANRQLIANQKELEAAQRASERATETLLTNEDIYETNTAIINLNLKQALGLLRRDELRTLGSQKVGYASSGISSKSGSALAVQRYTLDIFDRQELNFETSAKYERENNERRGKLQKLNDTGLVETLTLQTDDLTEKRASIQRETAREIRSVATSLIDTVGVPKVNKTLSQYAGLNQLQIRDMNINTILGSLGGSITSAR